MATQVAVLQEEKTRLLREGDRIVARADGRPFKASEKDRLEEIKAKVEDLNDMIKAEEIKAQRASGELAERAASAQGLANDKGETFKGLGEFLQAVHKAGLPNGRIDPRLVQAAADGSSEGIASDGGFLVRQDIAAELFRLAHETGLLSRECRTLPIGGDANGITINAVDESSRATGSRWGGVQAYWVAEADAATASKPKFRKIDLKLQKLMALLYATDELLKDQAALESIATEAFTEEFGFMLDDAIVRGDGQGKPLGILNANALISVAAETGQAASTIVFENIINMFAQMWARSFLNAKWYINQLIWPQLFKMALAIGTAGAPAYMPPTGLAAAPFGTLLGKPVIPIEQASALGSVGDIMLLDLSQYVLAEKGGLESAMSIHVKFLNDETAFRWVLRVDGQPIWRTTLTPYKGALNFSPFVTLAAR